MKSLLIIGAGMGGLATGIYGQRNGFATTIFEAHTLPGGQCTSWKRKGYTFDACIHYFGGGSGQTRHDAFWQELGALPCEMVETRECASVVFPDGTYVHDYYDLEKLESHLKALAPDDAAVIDAYIDGIRAFLGDDRFSKMVVGSFWEKLTFLPDLIRRRTYFKHTLGTFGERFEHPLLRQAFPLLHSSLPDFPLFMHLVKHAHTLKGDLAWPKGGSLTIAKNMAAYYSQLGGALQYRQKVVKILTEEGRACGVELEDGTQHRGDFVVSNADGRKTILQMLSGQYMDKRIANYCEPNPDHAAPFAVSVFLGVKRELSSYPSALVVFLDSPEIIAGVRCEHLDLQIYGFDASMAPPGKSVIKIELFSRPAYLSGLYHDKAAYRSEKNKIAEQVITLLESQFPNLREDIEVVDVCTLHTWERFMGGTQGHNNYPHKPFNVVKSVLGLDQTFTLPGLKNFFFVGQWATSAGALIMNALSGRTVVQKICRQSGVKFRAGT
ncbi:MAG: NAD(P)/FAD-dependent oxidoreductase [Anaerolineae bacterium]|nr:NAD(P)/FAD-dependent oxidoreductase [Anaerolineae bacterium]